MVWMPFDERFLTVAFSLFHVRRAIGHVFIGHLFSSGGNFQVAYRCDTVALVSDSSAVQPAIVMRDVYVARGAAGQVLRGLSLEIAAGETVALVGRSGAGKSTALRLINGLLVPHSGDVVI